MSGRRNHHRDFNEGGKGMPVDWEDKYHREKEKVDILKGEIKEKDQQLKLFQTKIQKLDTELNSINRSMGLPRRDPNQDKDQETIIMNLKSNLTSLKAQNMNYGNKQKELLQQVESLKREKSSLIRRQNSTPRSAEKGHNRNTIIEAVPSRTLMPHHTQSTHQTHQPSLPEPHTQTNDPNLLKILQAQKAKMAGMEEELAYYKENQHNQTNHFPPPHMTPQTKAASDPAADSSARESQWKLQQLQTQYDYLHSKYAAQEVSTRQLNTDLSEYQEKVRDLRHALEDLRHEKDLVDGKAKRVTSLQETIEELREANRNLEKKYTHLAEFSSNSGLEGRGGSARTMMARYDYELLAKERDDYKARVEHLQEAVKTHYSALNSMKQTAAKLREEKDQSERKMADMENKYREVKTGSDKVQDQLRLYSGDEGLDLESLEKAITIVKRRQEASERLSFLENPNPEEEERIDTLPLLRKKLEHHQHLNVKLTTENEKVESMLSLQAKINKDLHKEVEALVVSRGFDKREMQQQIQDYERLAAKRLEVINKLEAQVRQLVYGKSAQSRKGEAMEGGGEATSPGDEYSAYDGLLDAKAHNLKPDENVLEIWVKGCSLMEGQLMPGSSSFAVIDFFDYESQATPVLSGLRPNWDFAATYRLTIDDFLIRYMATQCVTIEVNMAAQGDYTLLGRCAISLAPLLRTKPMLKLAEFPIQSANADQLIGCMQLELRLALPVSELYKLFLERHPEEKETIQKIANIHPLGGAPSSSSSANNAKSRSMNELEVTIHRASGLPLSPITNTPPTCYVHFQFLGHPDKFTNAVPSCEPEFEECFVFPMSTDAHQLTLLERSKIQFSLVDIQTEDSHSDAQGGLIGDVHLSLSPLRQGVSVADVYGVQDLHGKKVADVQISIRWKRPFKKTKELAENAL